MKKMSIFAALAAAVCLASCGGQAPKENLQTEIDSLSYMVGASQAQGIDMYLSQRLGIDSVHMADFMKGLAEGMNKTSKKEMAYIAGMQLGQSISGNGFEQINKNIFGEDSEENMSKNNFLAGFMNAIQKKGFITADAASMMVRGKVEAIQTKAIEKKYAANKEAGEKFLAENAKKEGVKVTESGLQYKVIKEGKGAIPTKDSKVKVHYKGTLIDGTQFDSSYDRKEPTTFGVGQVIKGWTEALQLMPVGSKWELYIPQELAYGARETGDQIKPFSALVFEVELIGIEKK